MKKIIITSEVKVNNVIYKEGTKLNVSDSVFKDLTEIKKCAKLDIKEKKK